MTPIPGQTYDLGQTLNQQAPTIPDAQSPPTISYSDWMAQGQPQGYRVDQSTIPASEYQPGGRWYNSGVLGPINGTRGGDWWSQNAPPVNQPLGALSGMDPQAQFQYAQQQLGLTNDQLRAQGADAVANWLNTNGSPYQWQGGGTRAADWIGYTPQGGSQTGIDYLNSNGNAFQWIDDPAGSTAGSGMAGLGGGNLTPEQIMQQDPGYQFRLGQGLQALQRSAAARGTLLTGGTSKALERYGQDYGAGEFQNVFNRNFNLAQLGKPQ